MCAYQVHGTMSSAEEEKVVQGMLEKFSQKKELEERVAKVKSDTRKEKIEKIEEINYNNKTVPLKTEKLKQVFKRVETDLHEIEEYAERADFDPQTQISKYNLQ